MKPTLPFDLGPFPLLGSDLLAAVTPAVEAFSKSHRALETLRRREEFARMLSWYQRQWRRWSDASWQVQDAQFDVATSLVANDLHAIAVEVGVPGEFLFVVFAVSARHAISTLTNTGIDMSQLMDWSIGRADAGTHGDTTETVRQALLDAVNVHRQRNLPAVPRAALRHLAEWVVAADAERLCAVFADLLDAELFETIQCCRPDSRPVSASAVDEARQRLAVLRAESDRADRDVADIRPRIERTMLHVVSPITELFKTRSAYGLLFALCWTYSEDVKRTFHPWIGLPENYRTLARPGDDVMLKGASADPFFWYLGVSSLLRGCGATLGYGLHGWAVELLCQSILHPTKLLRFDVPREALPTRAMLAKVIAPMLVGHHARDSLVGDIRTAHEQRSGTVIAIYAHLLAGLTVQTGDNLEYRNPRHKQLVELIWMDLIGPHAVAILEWVSKGVRASLRIQEDLAEASKEEPEVQQREWEPVRQIVPATTAVEKETWYYLPSPFGADTQAVPFDAPAEGRDDALAGFLRAQGTNIVVKPGSIVGALEYFRDMPAVERALTPHENVGTQRWHKLKRGAQRIYVRFEDGKLFFHLYQRRDWNPNAIKHAA